MILIYPTFCGIEGENHLMWINEPPSPPQQMGLNDEQDSYDFNHYNYSLIW